MRARRLWAVALLAAGCQGSPGGGPATGAGSQPVQAAPAPADVAEARQAYDDAVKLQLGADRAGAQQAFLQVAAKYGETRYGRQALRQLGDGGVASIWLGVTTAVAIPAFMKYIRRARTSEAHQITRSLFEAERAFFAAKGAFVPLAPVPADVPGKESVPLGPDVFRRAGFEFDAPPKVYFRYQVEVSPDGRTFTARALGDLNGDGVRSTFERVGTIDAAGQVSEGLGIFVKDELE